MWVFVERYGMPSALNGVIAAALNCHERCEEQLSDLPVNAIQLANGADPETCIALSTFDIEVGRLEACWYLLLRENDVEQWRQASARCRKVRRLLAPLTRQALSGAVRVVRDADLSGHPKCARAARRVAPGVERSPVRQDQPAKIAKLLHRDADVWRSFSEHCPELDDAVIERNLLRAIVRERRRFHGLAAADSQQARSRHGDLRKALRCMQRLIWQLELIGAEGSDGLGPLLADLRQAGETLAEQCAVAVFAGQLDKWPIRDRDRRRLKKAIGRTRKQLHHESRGQVDWPPGDLAVSIRRQVQTWALRSSMGD